MGVLKQIQRVVQHRKQHGKCGMKDSIAAPWSSWSCAKILCILLVLSLMMVKPDLHAQLSSCPFQRSLARIPFLILFLQQPIHGSLYHRQRGLSTRRKIISPRAIGEEQLLVISEGVQEQTRDPSLYKLRRSVFYRTAALLPEEVDLRQLMSLDESRMSAKNLKKLLEQALQEGRNPVQAELVGIKRDLIKLENFTPLDGCRVQEEGKHSAKEKERALAEVDERLPSLPLNVETLMGDLDIAMEAAPRGKEEAIECLNLLHSFFTLKLQWNISDHHHSQILTRQNDAANEKLWEAASAGDMELLKEALKEGADVNAKRDSQLFCTSMHLAAAGGHTDVIAHLAESGAVIDMPNCLGSTPLHWAAACDREEACQTLLNLGSNARVINWHGLTPADRAKAAGSRRTSWLLRRAHGGGARWSISAGEPRDTPDMRLFEGNQG